MRVMRASDEDPPEVGLTSSWIRCSRHRCCCCCRCPASRSADVRLPHRSFLPPLRRPPHSIRHGRRAGGDHPEGEGRAQGAAGGTNTPHATPRRSGARHHSRQEHAAHMHGDASRQRYRHRRRVYPCSVADRSPLCVPLRCSSSSSSAMTGHRAIPQLHRVCRARVLQGKGLRHAL